MNIKLFSREYVVWKIEYIYTQSTKILDIEMLEAASRNIKQHVIILYKIWLIYEHATWSVVSIEHHDRLEK